MSIPVMAFFNNKGGVGKTSLVYHVAWMMSDLGLRVVAADLDPQGNLSTAFLDEDRLEELWTGSPPLATIYGSVRPLQRGVGDLTGPYLEEIGDNLALIVGDMGLSRFEEDLSQVWPKCLDRDERSFRVISAFWRVLQKGATMHHAQVILVDLGPNLGAINRSALIASDFVVIPLGPDLYSLQGLRNLGPALRAWRQGWQDRLTKNPDPDLLLPDGQMQPLGYIIMAHSTRSGQPVKAYERWIARIPDTYHTDVLHEKNRETPSAADDPHCIAMLKHYRSLMPMAQEVRKPIFHLKPADGAIGSHYGGVQDAYQDFKQLTQKIIARAGIAMP
ncbi:MAG: AAA family ATPase [Magnetococcales bacterium]|nr:AAA family ATPase [Magnetococcales bacterium]